MTQQESGKNTAALQEAAVILYSLVNKTLSRNNIENMAAEWLDEHSAALSASATASPVVHSAGERTALIEGPTEGHSSYEARPDGKDNASPLSGVQESQGSATPAKPLGCVKPDTDKQVFFYEQDFYVLSNFSAFNLAWSGLVFPTSEHCYHWLKFNRGGGGEVIQREIAQAPSAHEAFKIAERKKQFRRPDWDAVKVELMRDILRAKARQHEYVRRKLLATGDRELIEDSWRDDFWGWGPNRDGKNMLGKLWMDVRAELRATGASND